MNRTRPPLQWMKYAVLLASVAGSSCSADVNAAGERREPLRIMVVDQGFDVSLPALAGKVEATYTLVCSDDAEGVEIPSSGVVAQTSDADDDASSTEGSRFETAKAALLARLAVPDRSCQLHSGIATREDPLAEFANERPRWNAAVASNRMESVADLADLLIPHLDVVGAHGTATAGIVAHDNPAVRLVLLEVTFSTPEEVSKLPSCLTQEDVDRTVALLSDSEIRTAFRARPPESLDEAMESLVGRHGVDVVNESFGRLARVEVEQILRDERCAPVELGAYFAAMDELERVDDALDPKAPVLYVKAAGNAGTPLEGPEDSRDCALGDPGQLLVGSYGPRGARSTFSNYGPCVDLYAPGEEILAPLPGGWLARMSGTSFSAPLVSRLIGMLAPRPFALRPARATLEELRSADGSIAPEHFPSAWTWSTPPKADNAARQALALEGAGSSRWKLPQDAIAMRNLTWPLRWVQARSRGVETLRH